MHGRQPGKQLVEALELSAQADGGRCCIGCQRRCSGVPVCERSSLFLLDEGGECLYARLGRKKGGPGDVSHAHRGSI